ncbi:MAG: choice-of-anchor J domain-containing protein [Ginsengibacter sp.]
MKKITSLPLIIVFLSTACFSQDQKFHGPQPLKKCGTMEVLNQQIKDDPTLPSKWKKEGDLLYSQYLQRLQRGEAQRTTAGEIIIPVVFHLVGSATLLSKFPDRDCYEQVEILNRDYGGKKADLYEGLYSPVFASRIGRPNIKFVLARRKPDGTLTNGIERLITDQTFSIPTFQQLKHDAQGGLNSWDPTSYLNIWGGTFSDGLLGVSTFPYSSTVDEQGVAVDLLTIGANACRTYYPSYNDGATVSHEVGHFLYLFHPWGDDNGACGDVDFRVQDGYPLPPIALSDDTPDETGDGNSATDNDLYGNISGIYGQACSPTPPGIMYMNFMNYYDDRALFMFSKGQEQRMLATIDLYRPGLKTTNGYIPPVTVTDAYLVYLNPFGKCDTRVPIENNVPVTAIIRNSSTSLLNSVNLNYQLDGGSVITKNFSLSLAPGNDTTLIFGNLVSSAGPHNILLYTSAPNGTLDNFLSNDTLSSRITILGAAMSAPLAETFNSAVFPPANWIINNPQDTTWRRSATAGFTNAGSATVQNFKYNGPGQLDELITPPINFGGSDSSLLTFEVANAQLDNNTYDWDGLEVYISADGGRNYKLVYKKVSFELKTVPGFVTTSFDPGTTKLKWRKETVNLSRYIVPGKNLIIKFRNVTANGNNTYIDDISVSALKFVQRDAFPVSIIDLPDLVCTNSIAPSLIFGTNETDTLRTLKINFKVDNGPITTVSWNGKIVRGDTAQASLGIISDLPVGTHVLTVYTSAPNGLPDLNPSNDTIRKTFIVIPHLTLPVFEGFENTTFPPANWYVQNPDEGVTWSRTTEAARTGIASMVIKNYDNGFNNTADYFISSELIPDPKFDSTFVSFDLSYKLRNGNVTGSVDTLEVQITKDCGSTFTTVWKKWGDSLQTTAPGLNSGAEFVPSSPKDWNNIKIDLTPYLGTQDFQLYFVAKGNQENDLYIDNINVYGRILPARLKSQGYLIYPNPFTSMFLIHHFQRPATLQDVEVYNATGQRVWSQKFNGSANTETNVNLFGLAPGIYMVRLNYTGKSITQKIIKVK